VKDRIDRTQLLVVLSYVIVALAIACLFRLIVDAESVWLVNDAQRFHAMAEAILSGLVPYIDYIDPKPPLLFFTVAVMDTIAGAGAADLVVVTALNVISALLLFEIGRDMYGFVTGYASGLLFLVSVIATQNYFLFAEPFCVLLLLLAFWCTRNGRYEWSGVFVGLSIGFKQYALLALIPIVYLMWQKEHQISRRFFAVLGVAVALPFIGVWLLYGNTALAAAIYWTFGIGPAYLGGTPGVPTYSPYSPLSLAANLIASIVLVLPTLVFAGAGIADRGLRTAEERTLAFFVGVFLLTLAVRQYLHYWTLMMPFLALLACRAFSDDSGERTIPAAEDEL
jgi:hypothetical protein